MATFDLLGVAGVLTEVVTFEALTIGDFGCAGNFNRLGPFAVPFVAGDPKLLSVELI